MYKPSPKTKNKWGEKTGKAIKNWENKKISKSEKKTEKGSTTSVEKSEKAEKFENRTQKTNINTKFGQNTRARRRKGDMKMTDYFER